jgi:hypothetical protein
MTFENYIIPVLTFLLGLLSGLLYKYADIVKLKTDVETLKINQMGIVALAGDVKAMRESILFKPEFMQQLSTICSEHKGMHDQIDKNTNRLAVIETVIGTKIKND